jgi:hypothetical protein
MIMDRMMRVVMRVVMLMVTLVLMLMLVLVLVLMLMPSKDSPCFGWAIASSLSYIPSSPWASKASW